MATSSGKRVRFANVRLSDYIVSVPASLSPDEKIHRKALDVDLENQVRKIERNCGKIDTLLEEGGSKKVLKTCGERLTESFENVKLVAEKISKLTDSDGALSMKELINELDVLVENTMDDVEIDLENSLKPPQQTSTPRNKGTAPADTPGLSSIHNDDGNSSDSSSVSGSTISGEETVVVNSLDQWIDDLDPSAETVIIAPDCETSTNELLLRVMFERDAPALELIKFDGSALEWPKFVERFYEQVHRQPYFNDTRRMGILVSHLTGKAKAHVEGFGISGKAYAVALKSLKKRFAQPSSVAKAHLDSVIRCKKIHEMDRDKLEVFYNKLRDCNYALSQMKHKTDLSNSEYTRKAVKRLPKQLRDSFARVVCVRRSKGEEPTLPMLETWLSSRIEAMFDPILEDDIVGSGSEMKSHNSKVWSKSSKTLSMDTNPDSNAESESNSESDEEESADVLLQNQRQKKKEKKPSTPDRPLKKRCYLHPNAESHHLIECKDFIMTKSASDKKDFLALHGLCRRCFEPHETEKCSKVFYCCSEPNCKDPKSHNTCLHAACMEYVLANSVDNLTSRPQTSAETETLEKHLGLCTLRPSHVAKVRVDDGFVELNVMYDSGATLSQIVMKSAFQCRLAPVNTLPALMVRTAGEKSAKNWGESHLYVIPLYGNDGQIVANVQCVGVKYIGSMDKCDTTKAGDLFRKVEDTENILPPAGGSIDLLIGNNHAELFPRPVHTIDSVVWAETLFGPIIHGSHPTFPTVSSEALTIGECLRMDSNIVPFVTMDTVPNADVPVGSLRTGKTDTSEPEIVTETSKIAPDALVVNSIDSGLLKQFDDWTREEDLSVCYQCDRCVSVQEQLTKEDKRKLKVYQDCLTYDEDKKRFVARMPWKSNLSNVPDNKASATKRLMRTTAEMGKDPKFRDLYVAEFEKAITDGVLVEVSDEEDREWKKNGNSVWYVNHFPVINQNSESTPLRVIMDPTSSYQGIVISDLWESPPNLVPRIDGLVLQFRAEKVPISMDIKRAYRTIWLAELESQMHRVVWNRLDKDEDVRMYKMTRNSWGMSPAGAIMSLAMRTIAEKYRAEFPHVYDFISSQVYVDDGTFSVDSVEKAIKLARDVSFVMSQASFEIKYFIIGGKDVDISELDRENLEIPSHVRSGREEERVLGLKWFPAEDKISLTSRINFSRKRRGAKIGADLTLEDFERDFPVVITPRMYVSVLASLYDVCGLATPVSIILKHEFGRICTLCKSWDEPLPEGDPVDTSPSRLRCMTLIRKLFGVSDLKFERCLKPDSITEDARPVLCILADSSQTSYGAAAYVNWPTVDGKRVSRLVMAKAKPLPKRPPLMTIPRGELMAAVFATRLLVFIRKHLPYDFERIFMISDSTIALGQIGRYPARLKTWAAGKVEEINRDSVMSDWYHVDSLNNVADVLTRGLDPLQMDLSSCWQAGPEFMAKPIEDWPLKPRSELGPFVDTTESRIQEPVMKLDRNLKQNEQDSSVLASDVSTLDYRDEEIMSYLLEKCANLVIDPNDSWIRMQRRIARVIRFCEVWCSPRPKPSDDEKSNLLSVIEKFRKIKREKRREFIAGLDKFCPTKREMELAKTFWIRLSQAQIDAKFVKANQKINPVLCVDKLWRALGRTQSANHTPIIIPKSHPLSDVLIKAYHLPGHCGADTTLAKLTEHFWIVGGRRLVNTFVSNCAICCKLRKRAVAVPMAPKHPEQITRSEVFSHIAIDLAGPYLTKSGKRNTRANPGLESKVWTLVIVCVVTGAVHLEIVESYNTADLLASLKAFTHFRGKPRKITADLGSQIVGAAGTLEPLGQVVDVVKLKNFESDCIEWEFIPSGAHSSLGCVERLIRIYKDTMEALTRSRKPLMTKLKFSRILYEIMDIMNDRPLAVGRTCIGKLDAIRLIRPNDLIMGRSTTDISDLIPGDTYIYGKSKYLSVIRENEAFVEAFWERWKAQVFKTLLPSEKWQKTGNVPRPGDIVLVRDTNAVRNSWTLAEVDHTHPSIDGTVRKATVRYKEPVSDNGGKKLYVTSKSKFVLKSVRDLVVIMRAQTV